LRNRKFRSAQWCLRDSSASLGMTAERKQEARRDGSGVEDWECCCADKIRTGTGACPYGSNDKGTARCGPAVRTHTYGLNRNTNKIRADTGVCPYVHMIS